MCGEDLGNTLETVHIALECTEERIVAIRTAHGQRGMDAWLAAAHAMPGEACNVSTWN
ncbi:hypothetical protein BC831DRAFT_477873 [Entophlyctis helioformis]|nr:hypothetical protein BC831DRAFT_477873 [Entophlyctis helioformis]